MTEFEYFTRLPPEIRNSIYELLLVKDGFIKIISPRNRRRKVRPRTNFGCLLRVNKQINTEAKTIFFARNTFCLGNGWWGSRGETNLHALKAFISRVPKACIAMITKIDVGMYFGLKQNWVGRPSSTFYAYKADSIELQSVARAVLKYFTGVQSIQISACLLSRQIPFVRADFGGDVAGAVKAVSMLLGHPKLKQICFRDVGLVDIDAFVEKLIEGNEEKKDMVSIQT